MPYTRRRASTVAGDSAVTWSPPLTPATPYSYTQPRRPRCGSMSSSAERKVRRKPVPQLTAAELDALASESRAPSPPSINAHWAVAHHILIPAPPLPQAYAAEIAIIADKPHRASEWSLMRRSTSVKRSTRQSTRAQSISRPVLQHTTNNSAIASAFPLSPRPDAAPPSTCQRAVSRRARMPVRRYSARRRYGVLFDDEGGVISRVGDDAWVNENGDGTRQSQHQQQMLRAYASSVTLGVSSGCTTSPHGGLGLGKLGVKIGLITKTLFTRRR